MAKLTLVAWLEFWRGFLAPFAARGHGRPAANDPYYFGNLERCEPLK